MLSRYFYKARTGNKCHVFIETLTYGVLTKLFRSGWLDNGQVLFFMFMDQDGVEVHKLAKKGTGIKALLLGFRENFSCGIRRVVPSGQDSSILRARVANHSVRFNSSCPLTEVAV